MQSVYQFARRQQKLANLTYQMHRIYHLGIFRLVWKIFRKLSTLIFAILLFPVAVVLYLRDVKRICFFLDRVGHLAIEPDTFLKAQQLGVIQRKRWIVLAPKHRVANHHLWSYWKPFFKTYEVNWQCYFMNAITIWPFMRYSTQHFINLDNSGQLAYPINREWQDRKPLLKLSKNDEIFAAETLAALGVPEEAWFVCVHHREGGFSPIDEAVHCHRNGKMENILPAIQAITARGGWVIRMGDASTTPLPHMEKVIDYAHHPLRSARSDVALCAKARFFLGNTSGIFLVATVFGVPSALANMIPLPTMGFLPQDIAIPKLYRDQVSQQQYKFKEIMQAPLSTYRTASLYQKDGVEIIENTPREIMQMTIEMIDRLNHQFKESTEDRALQLRYLLLMTHRHYGYGCASRIATTFLRRHAKLLT